MNTIDINTVLHKFSESIDDNGVPKSFGFRFIKTDGTRSEIPSCFKKLSSKLDGMKMAKNEAVKPRANHNLKKNGQIMVVDVQADHPKNLKVAHLTHFKDHNSTQWQVIVH